MQLVGCFGGSAKMGLCIMDFFCWGLLIEGAFILLPQTLQASMGYKPGEGLGKTGSGMSTPVSESLQKGRRGLGYMLEGLEREDVHWEMEDVSRRIVSFFLCLFLITVRSTASVPPSAALDL